MFFHQVLKDYLFCGAEIRHCGGLEIMTPSDHMASAEM